jgi:V8-like Glu-specific endopeptidase
LAFSSGHAAIFGFDDRVAIFPNSPLAPVARSTAISVLSANYIRNANGTIDLDTETLSDLLCPDEKFAADSSLSYACTGFLVAPDVLVTAGHCMVNVGESRKETGSYCAAFSWLFDYQTDVDGSARTKELNAQNLYGCKQIVYAIHEEHAPFRDFAVVQLDRQVPDRSPLKMNADDLVAGAQISMIGYPLGTPAKFTGNARITLNRPTETNFITNLDAFEGNSGSPVFNAAREVVGILVGGTPIESLRQDPLKACQRYNVCHDDGSACAVPDKDTSVIPDFQMTGSIVQRIAPVLGVVAP